MRLLICDDHRLLLDALTMAMADHGHTVVAAALDPDQAVDAARLHQPDACLLDVNFPHDVGLTAISRIHEVSPDTKVVMLSASRSPVLVLDAIAQGAQGFVGKEQPVSVLLGALEMASQGNLAVDPLVLRQILQPHGLSEDPLRALTLLTDREWETMRCIMDGMNTAEIADHLGVRRSTAGTHVQDLLTKLGVHSRLQAAALMTPHLSVDPLPDWFP